MVPGLDRLRARIVFVVGKGGVGKTTTAGALALGLADEGHRTHLLSTDPAHSLADLFRTSLSRGTPTDSPCSDALVLEELDAEAYGERWLAEAREPVADLFDRGTYLDAEDVAAFLDLSFPGVDEVAAALRLADLVEEAGEPRPDRIVVDTAPTGHTLRLLEAAETLRSWREALEAMEEKAQAVISALSRGRARLEASVFLDRLEEKIRRFEDDVLAGGDVVVVSAPGGPVEAETRRLVDRLEDRGLRVALRVLTEPPPGASGAPDAEAGSPPAPTGEDDVRIPWRPGLGGCDELRAWGRAPEGRTADRREEGAPAEAPPPERERIRTLLDRRLLLFVGKGGVGKTTCAAAWALERADRGPVTLLGTDPAGSLGDVLDVAVPADGARLEEGRLTVRQIDAHGSFEAFRDRYRDRVEAVFEELGLSQGAHLDRRVVASLLDLAPPGIDEIFGLVEMLDLEEEGTPLIVDTAPTGHVLRLLSMPDVALQWTREAMRVLLKYRAVLGLDGLGETLLDFSKRLKRLKLTLSDPSLAGAVVVSLGGDLVEAETERLTRSLDERTVPVTALLHNRAGGGARPGSAPTSVVHAPEQARPPVGREALRSFFRSWRLCP